MLISDQKLIERVVLYDDHYAYGQLIQKYQSPLRLFLRRMLQGDEALADDLAQDSFLKAYQKLSTLKVGAKFSPWLYSIAKNQFLQYKRKKRESYGWDEEDFSHLPNQGHVKMDLEKAMLTLKPIERACLTMCYFEDLTHEDVSTILEIPLGTLKTHVAKGKEKLHFLLKSYKED